MIFAYRYLHLTTLIQEHKPRTILEVGTWNGERAIQMVRASGNMARYIGFDLFEDATEATDKEEDNSKKHYSLEQVESRLRESGLDAELVKGNTRATLPAYVKEHGGGWLDFAFIDGGHSLTTIRSDWAMVKKLLKPGGVAVFDDYYSVNPEKRGGCNAVVEKLDPKVLPLSDFLKDGTKVHLARVMR